MAKETTGEEEDNTSQTRTGPGVMHVTDKAIEAALDLSRELKEFENSGSRRVLIDALRDNFLLARSSTATKSENARTRALDTLISRIPDMSEDMLLEVVDVPSKVGEFDLSVITGVPSGREGPLVNVQPFMGLSQRMERPDLPKGANPESNSIKDLGSFLEDLAHIRKHFAGKIEKKPTTDD
jgi:hypothetical protein